MIEDKKAEAANLKAIKLSLFYGAVLLLLLLLLAPISELNDLVIFVALTLFIGFCTIRDVRHIMYKRPCSSCDVDTYPVIITGRNMGNKVQNCPFCGVKI